MPTYKNRKCHFCDENIQAIDYKNVNLITKFTTKFHKIVPRYYSGTCLKHQKRLAGAIKKSRIMALIKFVR